MLESHSHKKFWAAIVILTLAAMAFLIATAWVSNELDETRSNLALVEAELEVKQTQLTDAEAELAAGEAELSTSKELIESLEATLSSLQVNYERLITGYGYVLRDPSYQEMKDFLAWDRISEHEYAPDEYTCVNFAADVKANAVRQGFRCAYVVIEYHGETGHAIIAFDTTDRGLVFVDPQLDWEVELQVGKRYYQCVVPPAGHYMTKPPYDDTISRIIVIW
ncbi:MAG: hypothetical protein HXY36_06565 [Chloroflexi bacterium]|nr:hypothetical protein [Chloroflexota bacterium]